ncbi:MAG: hypothetical protein ABIK96_12445 [bacterium]
MSDSIFQILARDEHVFVSNGGAGLQVVENLLFAPSEAPAPVPGRHILDRIHPNPFNARTTVSFELGGHEAIWAGKDETGRQAASGAYFFRLEAGGHLETKRGVLIN